MFILNRKYYIFLILFSIFSFFSFLNIQKVIAAPVPSGTPESVCTGIPPECSDYTDCPQVSYCRSNGCTGLRPNPAPVTPVCLSDGSWSCDVTEGATYTCPENECTKDYQCLIDNAEFHLECVNNACVTEVGSGANQCSTDSDCQEEEPICSVEGQFCDDGDPNTVNDTWSTGSGGSCVCAGVLPSLSCTISASPNPVDASINTSISLIDSELTGHNKHKILYGDGTNSGLYDTHNSSQTYAYSSNGSYTVTGQLVNYVCGFYLLGCWWYNETVEATCTNNVTVSPSLFVSLSANPSGGDAPLNTILSADVSGSATGTINYTFWWDCNSSTTSVASAITECGDPDGTSGNLNGIKFDGINDNPKTVSHSYAPEGTYTAKVIAERSSASPAEARVSISVTEAGEGSDWVESPSWKTPTHAYPQVDFNCSQGFSTCNPPSIFKTNKQINFADLTIFSDDKGKGQRGWSWTFGDGSSSILQNPTKTYTTENIYNAIETVIDKDGYTCSLTRPLNVQRPIPIWKEVIPLFSP